MIETFKVTIWYTAPTALRMLMSAGIDVVEKYDLSSLRSIYLLVSHLTLKLLNGLKMYMINVY